MQENFELTGIRMDSDFFRFEERNEFDPELVMDVLQGRRLGVIFRDVIPEDARKESVARFWNSPGLLRRDGEPSYCIGSYHWNKSTDEYLEDSAKTADAVFDVLDVPNSPWNSFRSAMAERLAQNGADIRIAENEGDQACAALIRAWDKEGSFALDPHEDEAQCKDPRQAGFEIQRAADHEICAVNMCVEQGEGAAWSSGTSAPTTTAGAPWESSTRGSPTRRTLLKGSTSYTSTSAAATSTYSTGATSTPSTPARGTGRTCHS